MDLYALVYLKTVKKYITVPEKFVFDLDQSKLKNNGVNRNQDFKIFWSNDEACDSPDFNAEATDVHPPIEQKACYVGRIYKFYRKFII